MSQAHFLNPNQFFDKYFLKASLFMTKKIQENTVKLLLGQDSRVPSCFCKFNIPKIT